MSDAPPNPYLHDAVMTASPEQLQLMLYDGAIRFASQARDAILQKDYETSFERLTRAQQIVLEMSKGLNYDVNRDLCERVAAIYDFLYRKLVDANLHRNTDDIDDAMKVLRIERETWRILVDKIGRIHNGEDGDGVESNSRPGRDQAADPSESLSVESDEAVRFSIEG